MQDNEEALGLFFAKVAQKDTLLLNKLRNEQTFIVNQQQWSFTLPSLYTFLQDNENLPNELDYSQFRKLIFDSPINSITKSNGAEIIISNNQAKVDKSTYALVWQKA